MLLSRRSSLIDHLPMTIPAQALPRVQRADARRNREAVVEAARKLMATDGLDTQMDDIAREAGVGVGTVYRHFPEQGRPDLRPRRAPVRAARRIRARCPRRGRSGPGVRAIPRSRRGAPGHGSIACPRSCVTAPTRCRRARSEVGLLELVRELMTRAQEAGAIRSDAVAEDIPMLMCGLGTSTPGNDGPFVTPTSWKRFLAVVIDGLRAPGASEMPSR